MLTLKELLIMSPDISEQERQAILQRLPTMPQDDRQALEQWMWAGIYTAYWDKANKLSSLPNKERNKKAMDIVIQDYMMPLEEANVFKSEADRKIILDEVMNRLFG